MQVYCQVPGLEVGQSRFGSAVLFGSHEEIDVAIGPEAWLGIEAGDGPALGEDRLNAHRAAALKNLCRRRLVHTSLKRVDAIGVVQPRGRGFASNSRAA